MQACQAHYPDEWDEEEYYLIWEDLHPQLEGFQSELIEIPPYAGILCLTAYLLTGYIRPH